MFRTIRKGERVVLGDMKENLPLLTVTLGWTAGADYDIDGSLFMIDSNEKIPSESYFVFYNNMESPDQAAILESCKTNSKGESTQKITVRLDSLSTIVEQLVFVLTIHEADHKSQSFRQVREVFMRIFNRSTSEEFYFPIESLSSETAIELGRFYLKKDQWRYQAVAQGYNKGLQGFVDRYYEEGQALAATQIIEDYTSQETELAKNILEKFLDLIDQLAQRNSNDPVSNRKEAIAHAQKITLLMMATGDPIDECQVGYFNVLFDEHYTCRQLQKELSNLNDLEAKLRDFPRYLVQAAKVDRKYRSSYARGLVVFLYGLGLMAATEMPYAGKKELDKLKNYIKNLNDYLDQQGIDNLDDYDFINNLNTVEQELREKRLRKPTSKQTENTGIHKNLRALQTELNDLVGLRAVKEEIMGLTNLIKINQLRKEKNLPVPSMSFHLVFTGNPGTGKTTVARLLAQIFRELGLLSKGHLVEVDRSSLVAGYVGQTALKTQEVIQSAIGGVLFIDEAYSLVVGKGDSDFGQEAIDILLKAMEDFRSDLVVIVAGYPDLMKEFISSNPGLQSRFTRYVHFADYSVAEMVQIFQGFAKKSGYMISPEALDRFMQICKRVHLCRNENFGNARTIRTFFEQSIQNQANRIVAISNPTHEQLALLAYEDLESIKIGKESL